MLVGSLQRGPHWQVPPLWVQALALGGRFALPHVEQSSPLCGPPAHTGGRQSGSAQSISPSQSLSIMSSQISGPVGTQPASVVVVVVGIVVVVVVIVLVVVVVLEHPTVQVVEVTVVEVTVVDVVVDEVVVVEVVVVEVVGHGLGAQAVMSTRLFPPCSSHCSLVVTNRQLSFGPPGEELTQHAKAGNGQGLGLQFPVSG